MEIEYRGKIIRKYYCVIDENGDAEDYLFTLKQARETIDEEIEKASKGEGRNK